MDTISPYNLKINDIIFIKKYFYKITNILFSWSNRAVIIEGYDINTGIINDCLGCIIYGNTYYEIPIINKEIFTLLNIDDDDYIEIISNDNQIINHLKLFDDVISYKIKEKFKLTSEVLLSIGKFMDNIVVLDLA